MMGLVSMHHKIAIVCHIEGEHTLEIPLTFRKWWTGIEGAERGRDGSGHEKRYISK